MNTRNPFTGNNPNNTRGNAQANPPIQQKQGFSDINKEVIATRGVKIKSKASEQQEADKAAREEYKKKFENNADKTIAYHNERDSNIVDSVSNFMKMSQDKTLKINRGSIADDVEREIRTKLIQLALNLNNDENEDDNGKGSIVILSALLKIILLYRDRINDLEFELITIKRDIEKQLKKSSETKA